MKILKNIILSLLTGANIVTIVLMVVVSYSDRINPAQFPLLGCLGLLLPVFIIINLLFLIVWVIVKWRRIWLPVVGFALAYVPIRTYIPIHPTSPEVPEGSMKVVTWNVAGYDANRDTMALHSVLSYLEQQQADIVCLQEDMGVRKQRPFERMKSLFPYNDTVHVNNKRNHYINAVGIHTRFPIVKKQKINLGSSANGSAAFFLLIDGDTVVVVNNHLESTHLSHNERQRYNDVLKGDMERDSVRQETSLLMHKIARHMARRAPQADAMHQYIDSIGRRYPVIVCGDFNDTPISYVYHTMSKGLTDCFVETGNGIGLSYNRKGFFFRIDHLLCSSHFVPYGCKVDSKIDASDHYPVLCWLKKTDNL